MQKIHILWFEDNFQRDFSEIVKNLEEHCASHDKTLIIDAHDYYPDDFDVKLFEGTYSLAFIDLNLDKGQKGNEVVSTIRKYGAYIDILMYSNNPAQLIELTEGKKFVENIFRHATYNGLEQKMKDVIDLVLYKELMVEERYKNK